MFQSSNISMVHCEVRYEQLQMPRSVIIKSMHMLLLTRLQNAYTEQCIGVLRKISALNIDIVQLPTALSNLQAKFRAKNSFSHIQRLHNMLYAYGATVVEIVRRKEFGQSTQYCVITDLISSIQLTFSISARKVSWK